MGRVASYKRIKACDPFTKRKRVDEAVTRDLDQAPSTVKPGKEKMSRKMRDMMFLTKQIEHNQKKREQPPSKSKPTKRHRQKPDSGEQQDKSEPEEEMTVGKLKMKEGESLRSYAERLREVSIKQQSRIKLPTSDRQKERRKARSDKKKGQKMRQKLRRLGYEIGVTGEDELPTNDVMSTMLQQHTERKAHASREGGEQQGMGDPDMPKVDTVMFGEVAMEPPKLDRVPKMPKRRQGETPEEYDRRQVKALDAKTVVEQYRALKKYKDTKQESQTGS